MAQEALQTSGQDPRIGVVLQERYRIVRLLGTGGMGAVYEAEHILIKRRVAIKVLHRKYADSEEIVARFHREAEAATSIGHPNIVEVTDMGKFPDGTAYMVLEFLEGRDLRTDISKQGPQPIGKVVHVVRQVCDALYAAHQKGIVHRDLKPDNIFLIERRGDRDFAKVLDFGISKMMDSSEEDRSLTQTGTALGTPFYMAPEQCQGRKDIDGRADIYSLGVIVYRALTGQYPFDDESYPMLVLKICTEPTPSIRRIRPDVPPELEAVVNYMLAKDRNHRYADCHQVAAALAPFEHLQAPAQVVSHATQPVSQPSVLVQARASMPSAEAIAPPPARSSRGLLWAALSAALVVLALVLGAVLVLVAVRLERTETPDDVTINAGPEVVGDTADGTDDPAPVDDETIGGTVEVATDVAATDVTEALAAPPEVPSDVHVTIRATPSEARIAIDGTEYPSNPFEADLPRGPHMVRVSAEGYETYEQEVSFVLNNYAHPVELTRLPGRPRHPNVRNTPTPFNPPPVRPATRTPSPPPRPFRPPPTPQRPGLTGFPG